MDLGAQNVSHINDFFCHVALGHAVLTTEHKLTQLQSSILCHDGLSQANCEPKWTLSTLFLLARYSAASARKVADNRRLGVKGWEAGT